MASGAPGIASASFQSTPDNLIEVNWTVQFF